MAENSSGNQARQAPSSAGFDHAIFHWGFMYSRFFRQNKEGEVSSPMHSSSDRFEFR